MAPRNQLDGYRAIAIKSDRGVNPFLAVGTVCAAMSWRKRCSLRSTGTETVYPARNTAAEETHRSRKTTERTQHGPCSGYAGALKCTPQRVTEYASVIVVCLVACPLLDVLSNHVHKLHAPFDGKPKHDHLGVSESML